LANLPLEKASSKHQITFSSITENISFTDTIIAIEEVALATTVDNDSFVFVKEL